MYEWSPGVEGGDAKCRAVIPAVPPSSLASAGPVWGLAQCGGVKCVSSAGELVGESGMKEVIRGHRGPRKSKF